MNEILICPKCNSEYEYYYEDNSVIHESPCKCKKVKVKKLDQAFKQLNKLLQRSKNENNRMRISQSTESV